MIEAKTLVVCVLHAFFRCYEFKSLFIAVLSLSEVQYLCSADMMYVHACHSLCSDARILACSNACSFLVLRVHIIKFLLIVWRRRSLLFHQLPSVKRTCGIELQPRLYAFEIEHVVGVTR